MTDLKLKFNKLEYQQKAIESITEVLSVTQSKPAANGVANPELLYSPTALHSAIHYMQQQNNLEGINHPCVDANGINLDIMMETGTGKTITFIETIYRLKQEYGLSKFIIVVPSSAICSGTIKNLEITKEHFKAYHQHVSVFSSQQVLGFIQASNENINVLITTFQSFNSTTNIIHKNNIERSLFGNAKSYSEAIKALRPVVIIDEPHRTEGDKTQKGLQKFDAQLTLRFGATFKSYYNLIYALDSASAFSQNLVKSITVNALGTNFNVSLEYVGYRKIRYKIGDQAFTKKVNKDDNLAEVFKDESLNNYVVHFGNKPAENPKKIQFKNGFELYPNDPVMCDGLKEDVTKAMIKEAILEHFNKEAQMFKLGIKVLSLFFIDDVNSYYHQNNKDGWLAKYFEQEYQSALKKLLADQSNIDPDYRAYLEKDLANINQIHDGYFAKSNSDKDNQKAIDLILRKKEQLLSFDTPLRFIFSKWALREGWDNPNIFVLTKLSPSNSSITKLQQIGRGLRLAVDQEGNRITGDHPHFEMVNDLEVIVPKVEEGFVESIQNEIDSNSLTQKLNLFNADDLKNSGIFEKRREANKWLYELEDQGFIRLDDDDNAEIVMKPNKFQEAKHKIEHQPLRDYLAKCFKTSGKVKNKQPQKAKAKVNARKFEQFRQLWAYINSKAVARYQVNTDQLVNKVVKRIDNEMVIQPIVVTSTQTTKAQDKRKSEVSHVERKVIAYRHQQTIGNFIQNLAHETQLTQKTIITILKSIKPAQFESIKNNPDHAKRQIVKLCNQERHNVMVQSIGYDIIETKIKNTSLTDVKGDPLPSIEATTLGKQVLPMHDLNEKTQQACLYYNYIGYDSDIEKRNIENSNIGSVKVFAKLPKVNIQTPVGQYNPDFAYVLETDQDQRVFLVIESKGYDDGNDIRGKEQQKIDSAQAFFKSLRQKFPACDIHFRRQLNHQELATIVGETISERGHNNE